MKLLPRLEASLLSELEKLIAKLSPDGVEYKSLSHLIIVEKGKQLNKTLLSDIGEYPVINGGITPSGYWHEYNYKENLITISQGGASAGFINYITTKFWAGAHCYVIAKVNKEVNYRYLYHFLKSKEVVLQNSQVGAGIPSVSLSDINDLCIPLPPLEVQNEIVRILDKFTELATELTTELTARRKQYEYYRDSLLDLEAPMVKLSDIAEISRGGSFQKKDFVENGMPCIHYGQIYTKYGLNTDKTLTFVNEKVFDKSKKAKPHDIIMAVTSENIEDVCKCVVWLGDNDVAVSGHTAIIHHNVNSKYLGYYFSTSHFFKQKEKIAHGTKVIEVTPSALNDILIPLSPIEEQQRIVDILDRFDKLCNDISEGLPAEIDARKKQYEYYRDKLLNFKKLECYN